MSTTQKLAIYAIARDKNQLSPFQEADAFGTQNLCEGGKKIWDKSYAESKVYTSIDCGNGMEEVRRIGVISSVFPSIGVHQRCNCKWKVSFLAPRKHEICADNKMFQHHRWPQRFLIRENLETSKYSTDGDTGRSVTQMEGNHSGNATNKVNEDMYGIVTTTIDQVTNTLVICKRRFRVVKLIVYLTNKIL